MSLKKGITCALAAATMAATAISLAACNGAAVSETSIKDLNPVFEDPRDGIRYVHVIEKQDGVVSYLKCGIQLKERKKSNVTPIGYTIFVPDRDNKTDEDGNLIGSLFYLSNFGALTDEATEEAVKNGVAVKCPECFSEHEQE